VSSKEEAQTVLNNINSLEGSLNTRDNEILLLEADEDKTFSTLLTEAKQKLNEIINGGDHD
jgi:phage-related protein